MDSVGVIASAIVSAAPFKSIVVKTAMPFVYGWLAVLISILIEKVMAFAWLG